MMSNFHQSQCTLDAIYEQFSFLHLTYMTRLLFVILILSHFSCEETLKNGDYNQTGEDPVASVEDVIYQVRQETLIYLDTILGSSNKIVRFQNKLTVQHIRRYKSGYSKTKIECNQATRKYSIS
jgi:hypothetical protein